MVTAVEAEAPSILHRIGWEPDPLDWPPRHFAGSGRFDDLRSLYRVLYTAKERVTCFLETLAPLRPSLQALSILTAMPAEQEDEHPPIATVPNDWHHRRMVGSLQLTPDQRWLELRTLPSRERMRRILAPVIEPLGYIDLDMGDLLTRDRLLTMIISRWAYQQGYHGIVYPSRLDPAHSCWALFDRAHFTKLNMAPLSRDDPDLHTAAQILSLQV